MAASPVARRRTRDLVRRASIRVLDGVFEMARWVQETRTARPPIAPPRGRLDVVSRPVATPPTSGGRPSDQPNRATPSVPPSHELQAWARTAPRESGPDPLQSLRLARHLHTLVHEELVSLRRLPIPSKHDDSAPTLPNAALIDLALEATGRLAVFAELFEHRLERPGRKKVHKNMGRLQRVLRAVGHEHRVARLLGPHLHATVPAPVRAALEHVLETAPFDPENAARDLRKRLERLDVARLAERLDALAQEAAAPMTRLDYEPGSDIGPGFIALLDAVGEALGSGTKDVSILERSSELRTIRDQLARLRHALEVIAPVVDPWADRYRPRLESLEAGLDELIAHLRVDDRLGRIRTELERRERTTLTRGLDGVRARLASMQDELVVSLDRELRSAWATEARAALTQRLGPRP